MLLLTWNFQRLKIMYVIAQKFFSLSTQKNQLQMNYYVEFYD